MKFAYAKRCISFALSATIVFACAGCGNSENSDKQMNTVFNNADSGSVINTSADWQAPILKVAENAESKDPASSSYNKSAKVDISKYNIVYQSDLSSDTETEAYKIRRAAYKVAGSYPKYESDKEIPASEAAKAEILVGNTDRSESAKALELLQGANSVYHNDYVIAFINGKLVINAYLESKLEEAIKYFTNSLMTGDNAKKFPNNYSYINHVEIKTALSIGGADISNFVIAVESAPTRMLYKGCEELQKTILDFTEYEIPIIRDDDSSAFKNRIQVVINGTDPNKFGISISNGCMLVTAGHQYSANAALHKLAVTLASLDKKYSYNIPKTFTYSDTYSKATANTDVYNLKFTDEFNGSKIDESIWNVQGSDLSMDEVDTSKKNHEVKYEGDFDTYLQENVQTKGGKAVLTVKNKKINNGNNNAYFGGGILSNFQFQYGLIEIRAKLPSYNGIATSFWICGNNTLDQNYRGEIDIFESFGHPSSITSNLHSWWVAGRKVLGHLATEKQIEAGHTQHLSSNDGNSYALTGGKKFGDAFHTISLEWTPDFIEFSCDGVPYCKVAMKSLLTDPEYGFLVNEYMMFLHKPGSIRIYANAGQEHYRDTDETTVFPDTYEIDYIHLYQQDGIGTFGEVY